MVSFLADSLNPQTPIDFIQWGGIVGLLQFAVVAFLKEWIVPGSRLREEKANSARWMELALKSTNLAESLDQLRKERPL